MDRRSFLRGSTLTAAGLWVASGCTPPPFYEPPGNGTPFTSGVLSGLHSPTEVVLWTRLDPDAVPGTGEIEWEIATDAAMAHVVDHGSTAVGPDADWTAKVLVGGLDPDRSYWYRFSVEGRTSPTGRARTLPPAGSTAPLRIAFASCQQWTDGWYTAWGGMAAEDVDAVVWLGDYIYESGATVSLGDVRRDPVGAVNDLAGYRAKYRLYRSDPLVQAGHSAHPFVPIWDDHEVHDNYSTYDIAKGPARVAAAYRAWFEYMPVWPIDGTRIYRRLRWGRTADLSLLDTRQYRDRQANGFVDPDIQAYIGAGATIVEANLPDRTILGQPQRQWLFDGLSIAQDDGVTWKLVGNQVMISPWRAVDLSDPVLSQINPQAPRHDGIYFNLDSWDSYMAERDALLGHLAEGSIANTAFLTGDVHMFFQSTLRADFDDAASPFVANEFVGGAVSSQAIGILRNDDISMAIEKVFRDFNPGFRYCDFRRNGYGLLGATQDEMTVTYRAVRTFEQNQPVHSSIRFRMQPGNPTPATEPIIP